MSLPAIQIEGLRVEAGSRRILEVERLEVGSGEVVAVMGPNGAGKSTLLRACLGMQGGVSGRVSVLGQAVGRLNHVALTRLRRSIGYVPQALPARSQMPLTVREVVGIGRAGRAGLFRPMSRVDKQAVEEWMERLGIADLAGRAFHEISGGEQRKAVIARAMAQEPRVVLLDEPTANLDLGWRERMVEAVQSLCVKSDLAVVLVCHELEVLPPGCRRVVLLNRGRVVGAGEPQDVFTEQRIIELFGPGLMAIHRGNRHAVIPLGGAA